MNDQLQNFQKILDVGVRFDNRAKDAYRPIVVETGLIETAEGSARVKIGDTEVIAGVKMEVATPFPDTPDEGVLMVNVELSPIANPDFELGQPGFNAIELARVTDRGIRESRSIDVHKLSIIDGEKVWVVNVDICVLNDDGNLFDASSLAALAAIKDAKLPGLTKDNKVDTDKKTTKKLPLLREPIGVTIHKVGNHLIVDPTLREEELSEARLTVTSVEDGMLCSLQKGGEATISKDIALEMVSLAVKKAKELRKQL